LGFHIPKGYIYSAMAFSVLVEAVNIFAKQRRLNKGGHAVAKPAAALATAHVDATPAKPRTKATPTARAQSRPKSAPRKPKAPKP
jgi:hypothetical protein